MKKAYATALSEDRRLNILRILAELPAWRANSSTLYTLLAQWGHHPSRDQVKSELRWLADQQLLELDEIAGGSVLVATLTERGEDVAAARIVVDGVKRARS
ncbi:ArsR family transcriptional regulator [Allofranklinella schreckenbergeri]|uniref:ArsR family transcriptional regulator n=1 Tax=Allofranklinella schreckenbergeri TaxID=1076744 RepID=A0A3M6QX02_9BURK|nr:ArsR family transcriptional regulator [Allofranklinella schreckenbergeri]RMX07431.1 ArsR family transcriptional regulator [Allofranklinella schreckenbergeri]